MSDGIYITKADVKRLYDFMVAKTHYGVAGHFFAPPKYAEVLVEILPILCPSILEKDSSENNHPEVVSNATQIKHKENDNE